MKFNYTKYRLMNEAGDGEGGSGDGPTVEQLQAQLNDLSSQFNAVKSKNEELLTEAKQAKAKKREAEEAAQREADEKAAAAGNFKQLHESAMQENERLKQEKQDAMAQFSNLQTSLAASKIANQLAEGSNAELLAEFVTRRLKYADGEVKVTNEKGELTISSHDDLIKEFSGDARYSALLKGNQSSGGGANGGANNGGGAAKEMSRSEFDALDHAARSKFAKDGGKVVD